MAQRTLTVKHDPDGGALLLLAQVGAWVMVVRPGYVPFVMGASEFHARGNASEEGQRRALLRQAGNGSADFERRVR